MSGVKEGDQNEGPASSQTFDEQPSMIPHAADLTLESIFFLFLCDLGVTVSS